ncbi:MAG: Zn-dependent exopeptidase M28 [Marivirga sp.]|nr:Zn-dependent exopeptidase M28 [Marivirga sp.]
MISIKGLLYTLVASLVISNAMAQKNIRKDIQLALSNEQKQIVSALSGKSKIDQNETLKRRWTNKEKMLARNYLKARLADIGLDAQENAYKVNLPHKKASLNPFLGTNLFAIIPATTASEEYLIIGAHYDSVSEGPGAMDNATGCALVYSVSKLITTLRDRKKNLVIVFFDQEETGHAGSYAFVNYVKEKGFNVHSVHTADMVGWDKDEDRSIEIELPSPDLESVYKRHAQSFNILAYTTETTLTDHREFRNAGYNAVGIGGEYTRGDSSPHQHLPTDTFDTVNFEYLAFVTFLVYKVIEELITG